MTYLKFNMYKLFTQTALDLDPQSAWKKKLRIVGLDPAGPFFEDQPASGRLDSTDAQFVDVIHTDANNPWYWFNMGLQRPIGHADFYPKGSGFQPGCPTFLDLWKHSVMCIFIQVSSITVVNKHSKLECCRRVQSIYLYISQYMYV